MDRTKKAFIALRKTQSPMVNLSLPGRRLEVSDEIAKLTIFIPNSWSKRKGLLDASRTAFLGSGLFWAWVKIRWILFLNELLFRVSMSVDSMCDWMIIDFLVHPLSVCKLTKWKSAPSREKRYSDPLSGLGLNFSVRESLLPPPTSKPTSFSNLVVRLRSLL